VHREKGEKGEVDPLLRTIVKGRHVRERGGKRDEKGKKRSRPRLR